MGICSVIFPCFLVVSTSKIDCLERLVSMMNYYVSIETLNPTHSVNHSHCDHVSVAVSCERDAL